MPRIHPKLFERHQDKLGIGPSAVYKLIDKKVHEAHLSRPVAAIAVAAERGINISKYATPGDLAEIRGAGKPPANAATPNDATAPAPRASGAAPTRAKTAKAARKSSTSNTSVFVVHGRDTNARDELFKFLRAIGLNPIEWNKAIAMTGEPSPYVGTILEVAFKNAAAIVVLLTADDVAKLKPRFQRATDPTYEKTLTGQARPNVLFEAGMAFGRNDKNTVLIQLGSEMRPFSDIAGRHVVHLSGTPASRRELATKLKNAGCKVDLDGTDWLLTGNF